MTMCYAYKPTLPPLSMPQISSRAAPSEPRYFTFDPLPEDEKSPAHRNSSKTSKLKKRSRKVLYPPVVKRYYPTERRSYAKHLLFLFLTIVFFQIYSAEEDLLLAAATLEDMSGCSLQAGGSRGQPVLSEQPITAEQPAAPTSSLEIVAEANASDWHWEEGRSTIDITHFLQQNPAAF